MPNTVETQVKETNVVKVDKEAMAAGYMAMAEINLEEANAGSSTYMDGLFD